MARTPTRREPVSGEEMRAKMLKLGDGELSTHGLLDGHNVNPVISHIFNELVASAVLAETVDVPKEYPHLKTGERLLDPGVREALRARRSVAMHERVWPRALDSP